ncbi:MAG: helix-turn-helix transcriptional regulator [Coriobacteriia bacterium]|nr:helix-turn-helix transcriptional regulator [Coriobacteriia bacterium]
MGSGSGNSKGYDAVIVDAEHSSLTEDMLKLWPSLPLLGLGVWLAWCFIAFNGVLWLSDSQQGDDTLMRFTIGFFGLMGITLFTASFLPSLIQRLLSYKWVVMALGFAITLGCILIVLSGSIFFQGLVEKTEILFFAGILLGGISGGLLVIKLGELLGALKPGRLLLSVGYSQIILAVFYTILLASPVWIPFPGSPSIAVLIAFCLLPLAAAFLMSIKGQTEEADAEFTIEQKKGFWFLPKAFWRLMILASVLFFIANTTIALISTEVPFSIMNGANVSASALLCFVTAAVLIFLALRNYKHNINIGKLFSAIAITAVVTIICIPLMTSFGELWASILRLALQVFEVAIWCILPLMIFQKKLLVPTVFGFGQGVLKLGAALGVAFGWLVLPLFVASQNSLMIFCVVCAVVVLTFAFLVFSEKSYENLFITTSKSEPTYENLVQMAVNKEEGLSQRDAVAYFDVAVESLAEKNGLSARESEILGHLARGYSSSNIAEKLCVTWNTVRSHIQSVYAKLDVHSRHELIVLLDLEVESALLKRSR